jgi:hypothetical protein
MNKRGDSHYSSAIHRRVSVCNCKLLMQALCERSAIALSNERRDDQTTKNRGRYFSSSDCETLAMLADYGFVPQMVAVAFSGVLVGAASQGLAHAIVWDDDTVRNMAMLQCGLFCLLWTAWSVGRASGRRNEQPTLHPRTISILRPRPWFATIDQCRQS